MSMFVAAPDIVQEDSPMVITAEEDEHNMKCEYALFLASTTLMLVYCCTIFMERVDRVSISTIID